MIRCFNCLLVMVKIHNFIIDQLILHFLQLELLVCQFNFMKSHHFWSLLLKALNLFISFKLAVEALKVFQNQFIFDCPLKFDLVAFSHFIEVLFLDLQSYYFIQYFYMIFLNLLKQYLYIKLNSFYYYIVFFHFKINHLLAILIKQVQKSIYLYSCLH